MADRLVRLPEVEHKTGLKKSSIYAGMKAGTFPRGVALTRGCRAWPESHVDGWINQRIAESEVAA